MRKPLPRKTRHRRFAGGAVNACVRYLPRPGIEVRFECLPALKFPTGNGVLLHIADAVLGLPLGLCSIWRAGPRPEVPVLGESQQPVIEHHAARDGVMIRNNAPALSNSGSSPWCSEYFHVLNGSAAIASFGPFIRRFGFSKTSPTRKIGISSPAQKQKQTHGSANKSEICLSFRQSAACQAQPQAMRWLPSPMYHVSGRVAFPMAILASGTAATGSRSLLQRLLIGLSGSWPALVSHPPIRNTESLELTLPVHCMTCGVAGSKNA